MKVGKESYTGRRLFFGGILLLLVLFFFSGCEKTTLGDGMEDGPSPDDFHGAGWTEGGRHGLEFMANAVSCDPCHGEALTGGISEVSCDLCHPGWEGDCTFCHGGRESPEGMSGWHGLHLRLNQFGCEACHAPVVDGQGRFLDRALHINGLKDVGLDNGWYDASTKTCSTSCHETVAGWSEGSHPEGWDEASKHGFAFFADSDSCKNCHGVSLLGGDSGISCDSCHTNDAPAWRSECTFCHGGVDNVTGAPPEGVYGETERASTAVGAHSAHVQETAMHAAYDCTMCHYGFTSFDDPNHIDVNNGAEMQFAGLAGSGATYDPSTARCASVYCHGDGRTSTGQIGWTADLQLACNSCHGYTANPRALSGKHEEHLRENIYCSSCHAQVVDTSGTITNKQLHTNGVRDISFSDGGVYDASTLSCSSLATECHKTEKW